jgi:hypothetical protein
MVDVLRLRDIKTIYICLSILKIPVILYATVNNVESTPV